MILRITTLTVGIAASLSACSENRQNPDAGVHAGPDPVEGTCSSPCGPNQVCDPVKHICVDACAGACRIGQICVVRNGTPTCDTPATICSGNVCGEGQVSCMADHCTCLPFTLATRDSCADQGRVCHQVYNAAIQQGGTCEDPRLYEFCSSCDAGNCGRCAAGQRCTNLLTATFSHCARSCGDGGPCAPDELCASNPANPANPNERVCLPNGVFLNQGQGCINTITLADGGTTRVRTFAGDLCFQLDGNGEPTEAIPTGTCSWVFLRSDVQAIPVDYCRSPGPVPEFGACKTDPLPLLPVNTCSTGLECVPIGRGNDGICLSSCNIAPDSGGAAEPTCPVGESCVNFHRFSDDGLVLGACMTSCNVFSTQPNYGCVSYGVKATSCVPTSASGVLRVSPNGSGICAPQLQDAGAEAEPCVETDAFRGAACQSGLICAQLSGEAQPRCVKPCDLDCNGTDGGVPARCATEANARCSAGRACTRVTGTSGTIVGFCL